jgi:hypothetical protein
MMRPQSIAEVASRSDGERTFFYEVMDFMDELRRLRDPEMLKQEPPSLVSSFEGGAVADAYLAAVAVSLARELGVPPPRWAISDARKLTRPWFVHPGSRVRAMLLAESPAAFRERNLFVSANALSRA